MNTLNRLLFVVLFTLSFVFSSFAIDRNAIEDEALVTNTVKDKSISETDEESSAISIILLYLPNRVLDLLDIFRARVRVGPGIGVGVRATDAVDLYFGSYLSAYVGLPGPRGRTMPRSPIGLESYNGAEISIAEATTGLGVGPDYSFTEFGFDLQLAILGFAIGFDPAELVDFIGGIFTLDMMEDDL